MSEGRGGDAPPTSGFSRPAAPVASGPVPASAPPAPGSARPRRAPVGPVPWLIGAGVALLGLIGTVVALNLALYSPTGFVERYLGAIDRRDLASALETPGVEVPEGVDTSLLTRAGTVPVDEARVVSATENGGLITVRIDWTDEAGSGSLDVVVEPTAPTLGLFNGWRFAESPLAVVPVTVAGADEVQANGITLTAVAEGDAADVQAAALAPSRLTLALDTPLLVAAPVVTVAGDATPPAALEVEATPAFVSRVQTQLDAYLDGCATQQVLQPAGCPFGTFVENRLLAPPTWSIDAYPQVVLNRGSEPGAWRMPPTAGTARVTGEVLSLFDGSRSPLDDSVPFTVGYDIVIGDDGVIEVR